MLHGFSPKRRRQSRSKLQQSEARRRLRLHLERLEDRRLLVGDITGTVFDDANANGVDDPAENGLPGWTVFVDTNGDGSLTAGEPSAVTDTNGKYAILGVPAGNVTVFEILQGSYSPTPGFTDHQTVRVRDGRETRVKFPNVTAPVVTGQIAGVVYEDLNENGVKEPGEGGIEGWTVFLDLDHDGTLTAGEPTAHTGTDGDYLFTGVPVGDVTVYEVPEAGMLPTVGGLFPLDGASDHRTVTVAAGGTSLADFGNLTPQAGTIQGTVWEDANGDGLRGATEAPLAGRTVFVDLNVNGVQDAGEPSRISDAAGAYQFVNIHSGNYRVTELPPSGWISADGRPSAVTATVVPGGLRVVDFFDLIPVTGSISGRLWEDANGNGVADAGEPSLTGWEVYLDLNANAAADVGEPRMATDASGAYQFDGVAYGNATVREIVPAGWIATNPATAARLIHLLNGEQRTGVDFGNREQVGTIRGTVWDDANGDRARGATESGLAGWTVFLDLDHDGLAGAAEPVALTDAAGAYQFNRVPNGAYAVTEVLPSGWITAEGRPTVISTTVVTGGVHVADFYNLVPTPGTISGEIFNDADANGTRSVAEPGLEGWQVYVDLNSNGALDAGEPSAVSDATGAYTLADVPYGTHTVREIAQPGFRPTQPVGGATSLFLLNGEQRTGLLFGNFEPAEYVISGAAFQDLNGNGVRDAGEVGLSGVTVYLDMNDNGALDAGEPQTTTSVDLFFTPAVNELGNYSFTHLARGTYHVREIVPAELSATPVAVLGTTVSVGPASATGVNFADVYRANEIHGVVFDDLDADGIRGPGDGVRSGVAVYIDLDRDDVYDEGEPRAVTGDDGAYAFLDLTPGAYIVREVPGIVGPHTYPTTGGGTLWPAGVSNTAIGNVSPSSITSSLANGESFTQTVSLTLPGGGGTGLTNLVDVFLLFDDTGSFTGNSPLVRAAFPTIISSLQAALPGIDLGFGVGRLEEYGSFAAEFATGRPFILNQPIVSATTPGFSASIQAALDRTAPGYGGDQPETDIEALYQVVTGLGFDGNNNGTVSDSGPAGLASTQLTPGTSGDVPSFASFTPDPTNNVLAPSGNVGGAGFRPGALPIILTATDTGFAYQPKGETSIVGAGGLTLPLSALTQTSRGSTPFDSGAGLQETVTALNALGALVIGLGTNPTATLDPRLGLESLASLTGAINRSDVTIANGTADPIAPGDPFYFQISSGFGATVADGVINAIQNAVTNIALDITVRASDPRVRIVNHTGTVLGVGAGQTASFDVEFVGDGKPHRFDLQFVREGTSVVLGSIPVVLGTPVVGEGYQYDELEYGEIHHSSDFGNYAVNVAPSFTAGGDVAVVEDAGLQSVAAWATSISPGPVSESGQTVDFLVSNDQPALFSVQPTVSADGTLTFTPAPDAHGTAVVTVRAHDNGGAGVGGADTSAPQTFVITITPVNDAPVAADDAFEVSEDSTLSVAAGGVLGNDIDVDGDALTTSLVSGAAHGTVTLAADGSFQYTPDAGYVGPDSFQYVAHDGSLDSAVATVAIAVNRINHAPVASNDSYRTDEDTVLGVAAPGVLGNDTDIEGDTLVATLVTGPAHGALTFLADGSFQYTPATNYHGADSFVYQVSDGTLDSGLATVAITVDPVNDAPVATNDARSVAEDGTLVVAAPGVLANDSDVDGDPLAVRLVTGVAHGVLVLNPDGSYTYTPAANYNGADSFTYVASDGLLDSAIATVALTVTPVNDAPVAANDSYSLNEDSTLSVTLPGVLGNDSDVDGDTLRAVRVTSPAHGSLTLNANGSFTYTPAANYNGPDSFTYLANDGLLNSAVATVALTVAAVNDAPVASSDSYTTNQDTALVVPARGVLANDTDVDGDPLSAALVAGPTHGSLTLNADGSFTYTPAAGYNGPDVFSYRASDGVLASVATVAITVTAPPPPATKFFVVDADSKGTFRYGASGASLGNNLLNKSDSKPRGVAANAAGNTLWVIDGSGDVFVYDATGVLLGQWQTQNAGKPEGVTVWGNDLWFVDPTNDRVYFYSGGASLRSGRVSPTSSFALNGANLNSTDLVTDGSHLWVLNDTVASDAVFRYTTAGVLEGSWTLAGGNPSPTGVTLDPDNVNHLWIVDASTDRVYQYDAGTTRLTGSQTASGSFPLAATNTNAQGIADPRPFIASASPASSVVGSVADASLVAAPLVEGTRAPIASRHRESELADDRSRRHGEAEAHHAGSAVVLGAAVAYEPEAELVADLTERHGARRRHDHESLVDDFFSQLG